MRQRRRSFINSARKSTIVKDASSEVEIVKFSQPSTIAVPSVSLHDQTLIESKDPTIKQSVSEPESIEKIPQVSSLVSPINHVQSTPVSIRQADADLAEIERIRINARKNDADEVEPLSRPITEEPEVYNGISSTQEQIQLLEAELNNSHKLAQRMAHEIELLKAEFEEEKKELEDNIHKLRKELHRTAPIEDNKFFSLSKDLRDAVQSLESLTNSPGKVEVDLHSLDNPLPPPEIIPQKLVTKSLSADAKELPPHPTVSVEPTHSKTLTEPEKSKPEKDTKKSLTKKKKIAITSASAVAVMLVFSALISGQLFGEADVDQELVAQYLDNSGEVAGTQTDTKPPSNAAQIPTNTIQDPNTIVTQKGKEMADASQTNVSFEETIWETFSDNSLGVRVKYPLNAVKLNKTDSNVTFQRKDGYIFKIQRIETGLDLEEYWKQIQATSLKHVSSNTTFAGKEALLLELQETTQYPGNRYLVKLDNAIIDIWFATAGPKFEADDIKRVDEMLKSVAFPKN